MSLNGINAKSNHRGRLVTLSNERGSRFCLLSGIGINVWQLSNSPAIRKETAIVCFGTGFFYLTILVIQKYSNYSFIVLITIGRFLSVLYYLLFVTFCVLYNNNNNDNDDINNDDDNNNDDNNNKNNK